MDAKINEWIQRFFFALASYVMLYCASQIKDLSNSVSELNVKLAIHISKLESQAGLLLDHESRLRDVEKVKNKGR